MSGVIAYERTLPDDPVSDWQISSARHPTIQDFAAPVSVNVGQSRDCLKASYFDLRKPNPSGGYVAL